jgi:nucleoid-associated protein YgaU
MSPDETLNNATLSGPGRTITFDFNPAAIVISHSVVAHSSAAQTTPQGSQPNSGGTSGASGGAAATSDGSTSTSAANLTVNSIEAMTAAAGITTIAVRGVTFIGPDVKSTCEQLHTWTVLTKPAATASSSSGKSTQSQELPTLTFNWGSQNYSVTLNRLTINYSRFTSGGDPVRAVVDMTFNLKPKYLSPTNPTSGGLPGRRSHVLTGAETLAGLSTQTYGSPGRWRQIATANGIQDPLRVQPGTVLYLPSAEESGR